MRYFFIEGTYIPKHCIYGPRPKEAVLLDDWEWYAINDNLHKRTREREIAEFYLSKEQNKRDLSYNITKNWQNTLSSIKTQSEQRRIERRKRDKQDKIDKYNEILESRKEAKKPILANASKTLFEGKDSVRTLVTALERCAVLTEREKEIEFKRSLKEEKAKQEADFVGKMRKDVVDYQKEVMEKAMRKAEWRRNYCQSLAKQVEERKRLAEEINGKRRKVEEQDIVKMMESNEAVQECRKKEQIDEMNRTRMSYEKSYFAIELGKSLAAEEEEENEVNRMINKYAQRFSKERVAKEANIIAESIANRERLTEILAKGIGKKTDNEEEIYEKGVREREQELSKREREKEEKLQKAESEMAAWKVEHEAKVAAENTTERVAFKWTILQNERKRDIDKEWAEENKRREREVKMKNREGYATQIREKEEMDEERRKRDSLMVPDRNRHEELLKYCDDAIEYAKVRGWKDYPIVSAAAMVKKEYASPLLVGEEERDETPKEARQKCGKPTGLFCYCFKN